MEAYKGIVNWAEELRKRVEEELRELEAEDNIKHVIEKLKRAPWTASRGTAVSYLIGDREGKLTRQSWPPSY